MVGFLATWIQPTVATDDSLVIVVDSGELLTFCKRAHDLWVEPLLLLCQQLDGGEIVEPGQLAFALRCAEAHFSTFGGPRTGVRRLDVVAVPGVRQSRSNTLVLSQTSFSACGYVKGDSIT